ncbi:MAG: PqqD family protein [Boseongicola sp.]|nr:PqqD family protein [Boseongicola sp.]
MSIEYLVFNGVEAPLKLDGVPQLIETIDRVLPNWSYRRVSVSPKKSPFFTLSSTHRPDRYNCEDHIGETEPRRLDQVNAICDLVSALPRALTDADDTLICLHAAAVAINGRLVVFPSTRRSGKSTLAAALAYAGHTVFSDDVLPIYFDRNRNAFGVAMGVLPRLRLPLPGHFNEDFLKWTKSAASVENKQYRYLSLEGQPKFGETLPIDGIAILDRQEDQVQARLDEVNADAAMDVLLYQNFTRDRHSADVLQSISGFLSRKPTFRLRFSDLADAVGCLEKAFDAHPRILPRVAKKKAKPFRKANLTSPINPADVSGVRVQKRKGTFEKMIGPTLYLADADGRAIHRIDALSTAIWEMLAEPVLASDLEQALAEVFPDVPQKRISGDVAVLLKKLTKVGLAEYGQ